MNEQKVPRVQIENNPVEKKDLYRSEKSFPFPDFDEEEFSSTISRSKPKTTNVLEYERKKKLEKRNDFARLEKQENKENSDRKKFKPSPIISPVYGILNEDYTIDDIKERKTENTIDVDWVRKKAFEPEKITSTVNYEEDETVTVKFKEKEEEKKEKERTIDDLLEDTADVVVDVIPSRKENNLIDYDDFETELDPQESFQVEEETEDDTLENDLFELIDSIYENREDGDF
ncbi:MAG: hypothetical protein E7172_03300 [Firmicutes bacterium]|nr:hypothetical protein [Bacillota bacterium]